MGIDRGGSLPDLVLPARGLPLTATACDRPYRELLLRLARRRGLPGYHLEKEYLQAHLLRSLFALTDAFVFKGGTALRHLHGLPRFSEDLDFNAPLPPAEIQALLRRALAPLRRDGVGVRMLQPESFPESFVCRLRCEGPLFNGHPSSINRLAVEVRAWAPRQKPAVHLWEPDFPDLTPFRLQAMTPTEMLAEKVRALAQRSEPRDLFDAWYLLRMGTPIDEELLAAKLGRRPAGLRLPPRARCEAALGELVPVAELPPYAEMAALVAERVPVAVSRE